MEPTQFVSLCFTGPSAIELMSDQAVVGREPIAEKNEPRVKKYTNLKSKVFRQSGVAL